MEEIVESGIQFRPHQEETAINGGKHHKLSKATYPITLEKIEMAFFEESKEHHAEQVFKYADWRKNVEETVLGVITVEPEIVRKAEERSPQNTRNKERSKEHPKRTIVLFEKPAAEPRCHRVAHKKAGKGPRRFIQFHAQIGHNGPSKRQVQKQASPRVSHLGKARRGAITDFRETRQMRVTAELEDKHDEHEECHEEVQAVKFRNAAEHERHHGNLSIGVAELACEKETGQHVENACSERRCIHDRHNPLVIGHVVQRTGRTQVQHHNINTC